MPHRIRLRPVSFGCLVFALFGSAAVAKPVLPQLVFGAPQARIASERIADPDEAAGEPKFDTTTTPLPANVPSVGYHITATSELGDLVRLEGAAHFIDSVTITMSSWAIRSDYPGSSALGFTHPITLKLYEVDRSSSRPQPGAKLVEITTPSLIPWRPEPDPLAPPSPLRPWRASDGNHYGGFAFNLTFDLSAHSIALPGDVIVSISFNTQRHGDRPLGVEGPYNSLSVGVTALPPSVGTDVAPGAVYWKTADGSFYADGGAAGVNVLRLDSGWGAYAPAVRFNNSPYGSLADVATRLMDLRSNRPELMQALGEAQSFASAALERSLWETRRQPRLAWGSTVFNLIAEAANQLALAAGSRDPVAPQAQRLIETLVHTAHTIAENAVGDAVLATGHTLGLNRAQEAFDAAAEARAAASHAAAIDELGNAWREAVNSVR